MSRPKHRIGIPGTYFVSTNVWEGQQLFSSDTLAEIVLQTLLDCRERGFYLLHDFVVMPDHIHLILTPKPDTSLEKAIQMIKGGSSHRIGQARQRRFPVWQKGFHEHWIRSEADYQARKQYIEQNPVKARLASAPQEYPYSSATGRHPLDPFRMTSAAEAADDGRVQTAGLKPRPAQARK